MSQEIATYGVHVVIDEVTKGGTNFLEEGAIRQLQSELKKYIDAGQRVALHLAPPCCTFSRARDRSRKTRLRSSAFPGGLPRCSEQVKEANAIALAAFDLAVWAARLGILVSLENPRKSYIWDFYAEERPQGLDGEDFYFCACMHGASYQKPTTLRCWNWHPKALCKVCVLAGGVFSCGRAQACRVHCKRRGRWDSMPLFD